jgi:acetate kinase
MDWLGIKIDEKANERAVGCEKDISAADGRVKVFVIPTNEELVIAMDTDEIVSKAGDR